MCSLSCSKDSEPDRHADHRLARCPSCDVVHEVVVLHLADGDDLRGLVGGEEADADAGAERQRVGGLEEDAARRDVAGHAVGVAEQDRLHPHREDLVEAQVLALLAESSGAGAGTAAEAVTHAAHGRRVAYEVKKPTCRDPSDWDPRLAVRPGAPPWSSPPGSSPSRRCRGPSCPRSGYPASDKLEHALAYGLLGLRPRRAGMGSPPPLAPGGLLAGRLATALGTA